MPTLHRFSGSHLLIHAGDHLLPHVHIRKRDGRECSIEITSLKVQGSIPIRELREELAWIATHRDDLLKHWERYNP